jgi:acetyl-CoA carboxylase biotin carboxyl carrier protein
MTSIKSTGLPPAAAVDSMVRLVQSSDLEVVDLRCGDVRVRLTQHPDAAVQSRGATYLAEASESPADISINAPLTGVYYARPAPELPPFLQIGSIVTHGQIVGLIETMKLFNEIVSEVEGEVIALHAADGDLVESDQPLVLLRAMEGTES